MSLLFLQFCLQRYAHSAAKMELFCDFTIMSAVAVVSIMSVLFEYLLDSIIEFFGVDSITER